MTAETGNISRVAINGNDYKVNFSRPISLAHTIQNGPGNPNCFHAPEVSFKPLISGDFVGALEEGSPVNFYNIFLNPHGSTTHTECAGHIFPDIKLKDCLSTFMYLAQVIEVECTELENGDSIVTHLASDYINTDVTAIILKLPDWSKKSLNYSGTNPIFVSNVLISLLNRKGMQHLLVEMPSIDKEEDGGALIAHKTFWKPEEEILKNKTITELISLPEDLETGLYVLNLQVLNIDLDVSPSHPIIYKVLK